MGPSGREKWVALPYHQRLTGGVGREERGGDGVEWDEMGWNGIDGTRGDGMGWNGMGWDEVQRGGMGFNGMGLDGVQDATR